MPFIQSLFDAFTMAFLSIGQGTIAVIPKIIVALIFFGIGWILAVLVEKLVESIFKALKIDSLLKSAGFEDVVKRAGHNLNSGLFVGALVKWFVILVFLIASFNALDLLQVSSFLTSVVSYLPQVIVAVLILMAAVIVGNAMSRVVVASSKAAGIQSAELLGRVTKWSVWIFALLTALFNLGIAPNIILNVVTDLFAGLALALGLSFGLGGKDSAQKIIEKTLHNITD